VNWLYDQLGGRKEFAINEGLGDEVYTPGGHMDYITFWYDL
jgi:hypothetical protein